MPVPKTYEIALIAMIMSLSFGFASADLVAQTNKAPSLSLSGPNLLVPPTTEATLTAQIQDDGLPLGSTVTVAWHKESGPGSVIIRSPNSPSTIVDFDVAGLYEMRCIVSDGQKSTSKIITLTLDPVANLPVQVRGILDATATNNLDPVYAERFLVLVANALPLVTTGASYYAKVDPLNQKTTFNSWLNFHNAGNANNPLSQVISKAGTGCCSAGVFGNAGDIGFGRRMVMARNGQDIAFWVTNYVDVQGAVQNDPAKVILTVCMEYAPTPGASTNARYIKYFLYDRFGQRITDVDFDGRGLKPAPLACAGCHGGTYATNGQIPTDGNMGAAFLPFDMDTFDFDTVAGFDRASQEAAFKSFNRAILKSNPPAPVKEVIEGWYGGFELPADTQNAAWVPPAWRSEPELYRQVVAKSCRNCHFTRTNSILDFDSSSDFSMAEAKISGNIVFGPSLNGYRMPHAERTFERFWLSTNPHQPGLLQAAFQNGTFVGLGTPVGRVFVDLNAAGANDGSSWTDAYTDLQVAMTAATSSGATEIWVAQGTYLPSIVGLADPRDARFTLPDGVRIIGGFVGGETLFEERDARLNPTILSGDLLADDVSPFVGTADNAYHVVQAGGVGQSTHLDGFTIRAGNAQGGTETRGGGALVVGGSATFLNCLFHDNEAPDGGALYVDGAALDMRATRLINNSSVTTAGGILATNASDLNLESCVFSYNVALDPLSDGGAIHASGGKLRLSSTTISRNYSFRFGGGLFLTQGVQAQIDNTIIWRSCDGGVGENTQIYQDASMPAVSVDLNYCIVEGWTGALGGIANIGDDPLFVDDDGPDDAIGTLDDDVSLKDNSPAIDSADKTRLGLDSFDLDLDTNTGEPGSIDANGGQRVFDSGSIVDTGVGVGDALDRGGIENNRPSMSDTAAGNIRDSVDGPHDIVQINGSSGGTGRLVYVATGQPMTIGVIQPPATPFAPFSLFLDFGIPKLADETPLLFGIGSMVFRPAPLIPFQTSGFVLADNIGLGYGKALPSNPAPWSFLVADVGMIEADLVLQGIVYDPTKAIPFSVTNAVIVSIRENPPVNFPPIADVVSDSIGAFTSSAVMIDGSPSSDPEGGGITFSWMQTSGTAVVLTGADTAMLSFTAPAMAEVLTFELVVSDGVNLSTPKAVTVTVVSDTPIANAGNNQSVITNANVNLDGSLSSDPQGTPLIYSWMQTSGTAVTLLNSTTVSPSFTAPDASATLVFSLVVSDGVNMSTVDTVTIQVLTSFANDVYPILQGTFIDCGGLSKTCMVCHGPPGFSAGMDFSAGVASVYATVTATTSRVNTTTPSASFLLRKPLDVGAGGVAHTGGDIWCSTNDPNYVTILNWISEGALNN